MADVFYRRAATNALHNGTALQFLEPAIPSDHRIFELEEKDTADVELEAVLRAGGTRTAVRLSGLPVAWRIVRCGGGRIKYYALVKLSRDRLLKQRVRECDYSAFMERSATDRVRAIRQRPHFFVEALPGGSLHPVLRRLEKSEKLLAQKKPRESHEAPSKAVEAEDPADVSSWREQAIAGWLGENHTSCCAQGVLGPSGDATAACATTLLSLLQPSAVQPVRARAIRRRITTGVRLGTLRGDPASGGTVRDPSAISMRAAPRLDVVTGA